MVRHFLELNEIPAEQLQYIINTAIDWKRAGRTSHQDLCAGASLAMMFDKDSTRTRISFEVGAGHLGMHALMLDGQSMHFNKGKETIADTAVMLNSFVEIVMWRTHAPERMRKLAKHLRIPLINGLTDKSHPCQIMAELMSLQEHFGSYMGKTVLWCGDYNNIARSWVHAAERLDIHLRIAAPNAYSIDDHELSTAQKNGATIETFTDPMLAAKGVDAVATDVWVSMGDTDIELRKQALWPYQVNQQIMEKAGSDAVFMHCLPAIRGEEVSAEILDGAQSIAWQEAENRLHIQKAIMAWCLEKI